MVLPRAGKRICNQGEQVGISEAILVPSCPNQLRAAPAHRVTSSPARGFLVLVNCPHSGMRCSGNGACVSALFPHSGFAADRSVFQQDLLRENEAIIQETALINHPWANGAFWNILHLEREVSGFKQD